MAKPHVLIVGGGISGLTAAKTLIKYGATCELFEASDDVGGRARSDEVNGFILDRGFQVFLTAYPKAKAHFDYDKLQLFSFEPGASIRIAGHFEDLFDPWKSPIKATTKLWSPPANLADKFKIAKLRRELVKSSLDKIWSGEEKSALSFLKDRGFSEQLIDTFFRPFFSGVFLEEKLATSSRMLQFLAKMFFEGEVTLPRRGMGSLAHALKKPVEKIHFNTEVSRVADGLIETTLGKIFKGDAVIVAIPVPSKLLGLEKESISAQEFGPQVLCFYYEASRPPVRHKRLIFSGVENGPINHLSVLSNVNPHYAPKGAALISVSVVKKFSHDIARMNDEVLTQCMRWFGKQVTDWRLLKSYSIRDALPLQCSIAPKASSEKYRIRKGTYVTGDYLESGSVHGALSAGEKVIQALLEDFGLE